MTQMVMKADVATEDNESYTAFSEVFSVPEAGDWYVAIKAASKKDQLRMYIRNISITQNGASDTATPAAVTDLTAVAAEMGGLTATVSFTMPTVDIFGNTLPEDTQLKAMVYSYPDGEENELTGVPGQEMSVEVNTDQNMNTILVVVYIGENKSPSQQVEVYTGVDVPGVVHNVVTTLSEDNMTITLTWEPPTEGLNGGYFDPNDENIRYWLCHYHETLGWYTNDRIGLIDGTTVNYDIWDVDPQYIYLTGIIAENAAGICTTVVPGEALLAGPPVQLPIDEEISSYQVNTFPILEWLPTEEYVPGNLMVEETTGQSYNGATGYAISCRPGQPGKVRITLPKFESTGLSPVMDLRIYFGDKTPEIKILADTHGMTEPQLIKEVDATNLSGWSTVTAVHPNKYNERF